MSIKQVNLALLRLILLWAGGLLRNDIYYDGSMSKGAGWEEREDDDIWIWFSNNGNLKSELYFYRPPLPWLFSRCFFPSVYALMLLALHLVRRLRQRKRLVNQSPEFMGLIIYTQSIGRNKE